MQKVYISTFCSICTRHVFTAVRTRGRPARMHTCVRALFARVSACRCVQVPKAASRARMLTAGGVFVSVRAGAAPTQPLGSALGVLAWGR